MILDILPFAAHIESKENKLFADWLSTNTTYTFRVLLSENKDEVVPVTFDFHVKLHF